MNNRQKHTLLALLLLVSITRLYIYNLYTYNTYNNPSTHTQVDKKDHSIVQVVVIGGILLTAVKYAGVSLLLLSPTRRRWACKQMLKSKTIRKIVAYLNNLRKKGYPNERFKRI